MIRRALTLGLMAGVIMAAAPALAAHADPEGKVFVCKYVGTPGKNERLQTGQNPIDVSINAIKDYQGVGSYFNDAQGRSYVLAEDVGQDEPDVSECPAPDSTTRYRITIRMTGEGKVRDVVRAPAGSDVSGSVTGLSCSKKITAGFDISVADTERTYGPYTSKHGPVLRVKTKADGLLLKLRASEGC